MMRAVALIVLIAPRVVDPVQDWTLSQYLMLPVADKVVWGGALVAPEDIVAVNNLATVGA